MSHRNLFDECEQDGMGPGLWALLFEVAGRVARRYPPEVYNPGEPWSEEAIRDLRQDVALERLIGENQLDYVLSVATDEDSLSWLLAFQVKRVLSHRRAITVVDRLMARIRRLDLGADFQLTTHDSDQLLSPSGAGRGPVPLTEGDLRRGSRAIDSIPRLASRPSAERESKVYSGGDLAELVRVLVWEFDGILLSDVRKILEITLTAWLPLPLHEDEEDDADPSTPELEAQRSEMRPTIAGFVAGLSSAQRVVLLGKAEGLADGELAGRLGRSRPWLADRKSEVLEMLERDIIADLPSALHDEATQILLDEAAGLQFQTFKRRSKPRQNSSCSTRPQYLSLRVTDMPEVAKSALVRRSMMPAQAEPEKLLPPRVCEGDLRVVQDPSDGSADQRIGLVRRVDSDGDFVEILLVHTAPELATDHDVILPADITSAPYATVAQTDLRAVVWTSQLGERIGHLADAELAAVKAIAKAFVVGMPPEGPVVQDSQLQSGTRLAGLRDGRWSFKKSEGTALRALSSDCTLALLDQDIDWEVNPGLFQPDLLQLADDPEGLVLELMHWMRTRYLFLGDDDLKLLDEAGALDPVSWTQFPDLSTDLILAIQGILLRTATGVNSEVRTESRGVLTAPHLAPGSQEEEPNQVQYLGAKDLVLA